MRKVWLGATAALSLVAGCTVGPDYHAPAASIVPAQYSEPHATEEPSGARIDPARWWQSFGDTELDGLIQRALAQSPDIAIAASRIRQARLQEIVAGAQGKPTLDATAGSTYLHFSKNAGFSSLASLFGGGGAGGSSGGSSSGIALPGSSITTYDAGFDASWELDLFGGGRRGVEAARAQADAAIWSQRDAAVTLAAEVAQTYFALRLDQAQIAIIEDELARQKRDLEIAAHVADAGLSPQIDVTRQRASFTGTQARLQPIRSDADVRTHALAVLLGAAPGSLHDELDRAAPAMRPVPVVPAGLPSDLLRRRPDIRAAERQLAATNANIGVAVADMYPKFDLTGMAQLISTALGTLFEGDSLQLTAMGAARFPLIDWGRRRATVGAREEDREQAYQNYRSAVLQALRDVEDPLAQLATERDRNATLRRAVADSEATAHAVEAQYRTGFVAQNELLEAQTSVLSAREQVAASDAQLRQITIALFKALGGGWEAAPAVTAPSYKDADQSAG